MKNEKKIFPVVGPTRYSSIESERLTILDEHNIGSIESQESKGCTRLYKDYDEYLLAMNLVACQHATWLQERNITWPNAECL